MICQRVIAKVRWCLTPSRLSLSLHRARFPLLLEPVHGRARTFLMATLAKLLFTQSRYAISSTSASQHVQHTLVAAVRAARYDLGGVAGGASGQAVAEDSGQEQLTPKSAATVLRGMTAPERGEAFFLMFMVPITETAAGILPFAVLAQQQMAQRPAPPPIPSSKSADQSSVSRFTS